MTNEEKDCIFCKIIRQEIPSTKVWENEKAVAIRDINPQAPQHVLVIPKEHIASLGFVEDGHKELLGGLMLSVRDAAQSLGIGEAFQVKVFSGEKAGQTVFHLHIHVMGGWEQAQHH